jgi:hypothetical protein
VTRLRVLATLGGALAIASVAGASTQRITMTAYPTRVTSFDPVVLAGTVDGAAEGDLVTVEGKECGVPGSVYRALTGTQAGAGGAWRAEFRPRTKTRLRATWKDSVSNEVTVQMRALVTLVPRPGTKLRITVFGISSAPTRKVTLERLDTRTRSWRTVRVVKVPSRGGYAEAVVRVKVPKGTTLRAVLPLSQAKPCYLPGYSKAIRT